MVSTTFAIARNAFVESLRQPVFLGLLVISGVLQLLNTWATGFSMGFRNVPGEVAGDNKLLFDIGLATVFFCGILVAAFTSTSVISREIENKTVLTVVSKPISRARVILGKYLGVAAAMLLAVVIMVIFLLLGIRHGVMSTAADTLDMPVILFGVGSVILAILLGAIANYLYGWSFAQTSVLIMLPLTLVAYALVLAISKKWEFQPLGTDFKPQITLACLSLTMALLVIAAIATAASTRLGQVMTIVVCAGVFVLGLLSNHLIGRHAYVNPTIGVVEEARSGTGINLRTFVGQQVAELAAQRAGVTTEEFLSRPELSSADFVSKWEVLGMIDGSDQTEREMLFRTIGSEYELRLKAAPSGVEVNPGDPIYYGPSPNGVALVPPHFQRPAPDTDLTATLYPPGTPGAIVVVESDGPVLRVRHIGSEPLDLERPPLEGDFLFLAPTRTRPLAAGLWALVPNMQTFWLVDAISQAQPIPASHIFLVLVYGLTQIAGFLALAVMLFQGRDVG
jgi:ABC-type transport system involved in multi-copper enzyme maturation permease subunit